MSALRKKLTFVLPVLSIALVTLGYAAEGFDAYTSLLASFKFLGTGAPTEPSNLLIELGRWCGLFFALNILLTFLEVTLSHVSHDLMISQVIARDDSVAFHGDGSMAEHSALRCGKRAVHSDDPKALKCKTQVLLYSNDTKALDYYQANALELAKADRVILNLDGSRAGSLSGTNIHPLNLADICAQRYWTSHPAREGETVLLIGKGYYAESLISWGLLTNVLSRRSSISYLVVGDFSEYRVLHRRVVEAAELCGDSLVFLGEDWRDYTDAIDRAGHSGKDGRIIVCLSPEESVHVASQIVDAGLAKRVHVRVASSSCSGLFGTQRDKGEQKEIVLFGSFEELCDPEIILEESHYRGGKIVNLSYMCQGDTCNDCPHHPEFAPVYNDMDAEDKEMEGSHRLKAIDVDQCLICPRFVKDWRSLSGFLRQSNYAVAVHDSHKVRLLRERGVDVVGLSQPECVEAFLSLPEIVRSELQEIEHLRWMRLYYLYNWYYSSTRDDARRLHDDLLPYEKLSETERIKGADAYKYLALRVGKKSQDANRRG